MSSDPPDYEPGGTKPHRPLKPITTRPWHGYALLGAGLLIWLGAIWAGLPLLLMLSPPELPPPVTVSMPEAPDALGSIAVKARQPVRIWIDRKRRGSASLVHTVELPPGVHHLVVGASRGKARLAADVEVVPGRQSRVFVDLSRNKLDVSLPSNR